MPAAPSPVPEGYHAVTPYLIARNASAAIEFYKKAFGAEELMRHPSDDGRLMHVHLKVNGSSLMMHDHFAEHHGGADLADYSVLYGNVADSI